MKRALAFLLLLLLAAPAAAQTQQLNVQFSWQHDGKFVTGFRLYKGPTPGALVKVADISGSATRSYAYSGLEQLPVCFGISAVGQTGESSIITKDGSGADVCLGKPASPTGFSFSVQ